jgi:hypothetical protein
MKVCYNKIYEEYKSNYMKYSYEELFDEAELLALKTYSNGKYPEIYPWLL